MHADLIIRDARIFTADAHNPWAEALAVSAGRLLHVGDIAGALALRGDDTEVRSVDGAFLMPGIIDGHNHPSLAGRTALFELSLSADDSCEELIEAVRGYAAQLPAGAWVVGAGWGIGLIPQINSVAVLRELDEAAGNHPVVLVDNSRHNRWANSLAMQIAGSAASDDEGVLRDSDASPTGVLLERAGLALAHAYARSGGLSAEQEQAAYHHSLEVLHSYGVTAFQDAGATPEVLAALHALDGSGKLDAWVVTSLLMNDEVLGAEVIGEPLLDMAEAYRSEHHRPDFIKVFLDGVPPARTAAMLEPYLGDAQHGHEFCGDTVLSPDELYVALRVAAERGLGAKVHATGDASTRLILDTVERLRAEGFADMRVQVAHGQYVADSDVPRFATLGVDADISPYIWYPGPLPEAIKIAVPAERAERIHPNRALSDAGVLISAGSDWPVSPVPNPWEAIYGLVTRADPTGSFPGALWPEQAITLEEALAVFTINGAQMIGVSDVAGSLASGKSADFVVLDQDPFEVNPKGLAAIHAVQTWFAGKPVFER